MSAAISFLPRHAQPFTVEQAMALEVDMLVTEISRLQNSIAHLQATRAELEAFIRDDPDGDEDGELGKAVQENDEVIASQTERVTLIKIALLNKVGEGGVRHMGLEVTKEDTPQALGAGSEAPPRDSRPGEGGRDTISGDTIPGDQNASARGASSAPQARGEDPEEGIFL